MEIQYLLKDYKIEKTKRISERAETIKEIYSIYSSETQKIFRKKENWKRYCEWCHLNKKENSPENQKQFKKTKQFIKEHSVKTICYFLSPIPTSDLYYIKSVAKDMENRKQNFSGYFINNVSLRSLKPN
jgi:RNA processing factor Prp31